LLVFPCEFIAIADGTEGFLYSGKHNDLQKVLPAFIIVWLLHALSSKKHFPVLRSYDAASKATRKECVTASKATSSSGCVLMVLWKFDLQICNKCQGVVYSIIGYISVGWNTTSVVRLRVSWFLQTAKNQ
jgi:hypothetical protein